MKKKFILLVLWMLFLMSGCTSENSDHSTENSAADNMASDLLDGGSGTAVDTMTESEQLAEKYREVYREASEAGTLAQLETIREIMRLLGDSGYAVVDTENQINMIHPEMIREFNDAVEAKRDGAVSLFLVTKDGGFVRYELMTEGGMVRVERSSLGWEKGEPCAEMLDSYEAHTWRMDKESGYLYIEKEQPAGYDGAIGFIAVRVEPLDEELRELNRKYILPAGYRHTNLFLTDWDESDPGGVDFYDLFEVFYSSVYGKDMPYESDFQKRTYEVPAEEFETVIQTFFDIDTDTLRDLAAYDGSASVYEYTTRCLEDWGHPGSVMPEVRGCEELGGGMLRLQVSSVSQQDIAEETFSHEVVIRLLPDGGYQYVSNRILTSDPEPRFDWYSERLTVEEWEAEYGGS